MEKEKPDFEKLAEKYGDPKGNTLVAILPKGVILGMETIWTDYVTPLQSQLSEAEKRNSEIYEQGCADGRNGLHNSDLQSQNERILSALKETTEVLRWHLPHILHR